MTPDEIERTLIVEFSVHGLQIGKSPNRVDRRERLRQAIYRNGQQAWKFHDTQTTYAEAFEACFGERLDRRAVMRGDPLDENLCKQ